MSNTNMFAKGPNEVLDYQWDWSAWLGTDTISTSTVATPTGLTEASEANTTTTATVWVSGGTLGTTYQLTNHIVTAGGRTAERVILIQVTTK